MLSVGVLFALLSGICNGLFTAPMKVEKRWQWENIWLVFIIVACLLMPFCFALSTLPAWTQIFETAPRGAIVASLTFGFAWGFGAICFGRSVDSLGVSLANSLVIGLSSALGSLVPLLLSGSLRLDRRVMVLFAGVVSFLIGVWLCGKAGRLRTGPAHVGQSTKGYSFALAAGIMSAIFNIGYSLALPIADTGVGLGYSRFAATNYIWLLMLAAGSIPNIVFCSYLMKRNGTASLLFSAGARPLGGALGTVLLKSWSISTAMGLLWGGSIFLYGAATPRLGAIGPSVGWPLSLAVGLLVANLMGRLLGEWQDAGRSAIRFMNWAISTLLAAIVLCALSTKVNP
jgi:L-rhamnose-H+ transport protein